MKLRIIGYTDQINECDCCGKAELKGTYVMADEMDNEMYFGKVCGAKHANWSMSEFSENLSIFKAKMKRDEKVSQLVENLKNAKPHEKANAERNILANIQKLGIDLLNEVFKPLNYKESDPTSNVIFYSLNGKSFGYDR